MVLDPFIAVFIRSGFALLLALTALHKMRDIAAFRDIVTGYKIVPASLVPLLSRALPLMELVCAALLLFMPVLGIASASALLGVYAVIIAFNIARGHTQIDCGCFWGGASAFPSLSWTHVLRNVGLIGLLCAALVPASHRAFVMMDGANLIFGLVFGYVAIKAGFGLAAVRGRMREFGHA